MNKIVMDTNVLFAGLYSSSGASHQILRLLDSGRIQLVISIALLFEYEDILKRKQAELALSDDQIDVILDNICALSELQKVYYLWRPYLNDPKDDHVLELAVASTTKIHNERIKFTTAQFHSSPHERNSLAGGCFDQSVHFFGCG